MQIRQKLAINMLVFVAIVLMICLVSVVRSLVIAGYMAEQTKVEKLQQEFDTLRYMNLSFVIQAGSDARKLTMQLNLIQDLLITWPAQPASRPFFDSFTNGFHLYAQSSSVILSGFTALQSSSGNRAAMAGFIQERQQLSELLYNWKKHLGSRIENIRNITNILLTILTLTFIFIGIWFIHRLNWSITRSLITIMNGLNQYQSTAQLSPILTRTEDEFQEISKLLNKLMSDLNTSRSVFHSLFMNMEEGVALHEIITVDGKPYDWKIIDVNPQYEKLLSVTRDQVIGKTGREVYSMAFSPYLDIFQGVASSGKTEHFESFYPPLKFYLAVSVAPLLPGQFATIFSDITGKKKADERLHHINRMYMMLSQVNQVVVWVQNPDELFEKIAGVAIDHGHFQICWIGRLDHATGQYQTLVMKSQNTSLNVFPATLAGTVCLEGDNSCFYNNLAGIPDDFPLRDTAAQAGCRSAASFAIREKGIAAIRMVVYSTDEDYFTQEEMNLMTEVATTMSFALDKIEQNRIKLQAEIALREEEELLSNVLETIPDGIIILNTEGRITYANVMAEKILEVPRERLTEMTYNDSTWQISMQDGQPLADAELPFQQALMSGQPVFDHELTINSFAHHTKTILVNAAPLRDSDRKVIGILTAFTDISERKQVEERLHRSEEKYRSLYSSMIEGMALHEIILNRQGEASDYRFLDVNPSFERLTGLKKEEILGRTVLGIMPRTEDIWIKKYGEVALTGQPIHFENYSRELEKTFEVYAYSPKKGQFATIITDISERKKNELEIQNSLKEKETLLKEIHHRVKNNLQIISSLFRLQEKYISDPHALKVFQDSQNRVKSMAMVHEKLYQSGSLARVEFKGYIEALASSILNLSRGIRGKISLMVDMQSLDLPIDMAIPCGLLLNELISNSVKYAFPDDRNGQITIRMHEKPGEYITLSLSDNGIGLPPDFSIAESPSLGMKLVETLSAQLGGNYSIQSDVGFHYRIEFTRQMN